MVHIETAFHADFLAAVTAAPAVGDRAAGYVADFSGAEFVLALVTKHDGFAEVHEVGDVGACGDARLTAFVLAIEDHAPVGPGVEVKIGHQARARAISSSAFNALAPAVPL